MSTMFSQNSHSLDRPLLTILFAVPFHLRPKHENISNVVDLGACTVRKQQHNFQTLTLVKCEFESYALPVIPYIMGLP